MAASEKRKLHFLIVALRRKVCGLSQRALMLPVRVHSSPTSLWGIDLSLASIRAVAGRVFRSLRMFGTVCARYRARDPRSDNVATCSAKVKQFMGQALNATQVQSTS